MLSKLVSLQGVLLIMMAAVASLWLAVTDQLKLYIHPRYIVFSVALCVIGLFLGAVSTGSANEQRQKAKALVLSVLLLAGALISLLVLRPATLSSSVANQRGVNSSAISADLPQLPIPQTVQLFENNDFSQLSIKDWANLLAQTTDSAFFAGKEASVSGFITVDPSDDQNMFFVSRFVISCCTVDARPVGVPVYIRGWQDSFERDQWVTVSGPFAVNPSHKSSQTIVIVPKSIQVTAQPKDPYVY